MNRFRLQRVWPVISLVVGNAGRAATQALLLWVFASQGGAASAGEFALALACLSPLFVLLELALRNVYQTTHVRASFRTFFAIRLVCAGAAAVIGLAAAVAFPELLPPVDVVGAMACLKFFDSLVDIFKGRLLAEGKIREASSNTWWNVVTTTVLVLAAVALSRDPVWALMGSAASSAIVLASLVFRLLLREDDPWVPRWSDVGPILTSGVRLGVAQTVISAAAFTPTFYLGITGSTSTVGVFAACQYAVTLTNLLFNSVQQVTLRSLRARWLSGEKVELMRALRRHTFATVGLATGLAAMMVIALPVVLPIVFGPEFEVPSLQVMPLGLAMVALGADYMAASVLMAANRYTHRLWLAIFSFVTAIAVAVAIGTPGTVAKAGMIMAVAYIVRAVATLLWMRRA